MRFSIYAIYNHDPLFESIPCPQWTNDASRATTVGRDAPSSWDNGIMASLAGSNHVVALLVGALPRDQNPFGLDYPFVSRQFASL